MIERDNPKTPNTMMTVTELNRMNIDDLRALNGMIIDVIKRKKTEVAHAVKNELRLGANVRVNHPKLAGKQLRVEKINRTKAILKVLNGDGTYIIPLSMIEVK